MARTPAITRHIQGHTAEVLEFNLKDMAVQTRTISIPKQYDANPETRIKYIEKWYKDATNVKFLKVEKWVTVDKLVGMKYEDFLKYAVELDEKRRFPDGSDADDSDA